MNVPVAKKENEVYLLDVLERSKSMAASKRQMTHVVCLNTDNKEFKEIELPDRLVLDTNIIDGWAVFDENVKSGLMKKEVFFYQRQQNHHQYFVVLDEEIFELPQKFHIDYKEFLFTTKVRVKKDSVVVKEFTYWRPWWRYLLDDGRLEEMNDPFKNFVDKINSGRSLIFPVNS